MRYDGHDNNICKDNDSCNGNNSHDDKLTTWLFLGFIGIVTAVSMVLPQKVFSESENRYLQKKPAFSMDSLLDGTFGKKYETYLSDQFPGRNGWIGVKVGTEWLAGKTDINGVFLGKDDYLIERFQEEDLVGAQLDRNLKTLASFTEYAGIQYGMEHVRVMLVPSASQIMTDQLPFMAVPYDQSIIAERFLRMLGERSGMTGADCMMVPIEDALKRKNGERLYYRTDHHWTAKGAFTAYEAWARSAGMEPWGEDRFQAETVSRTFHGTVFSKLNIPWTYDTIELYLPKEEQEYTVTYDGNGKKFDSLYSLKALQGKDQYAVYLDGNHGMTEIVRTNPPEGERDGRLLIIKDSYAHSFAPFAANHFGEVVMVDLRYFNGDLKAWMAEKEFTDVLILYQIPGFAAEKSVSKLWLDK